MTRELRAALLGLSAYKALREEPLLKAVGNLLDGLAAGRGEEALGAYTDVVLALQEAGAHGMGDGLLALLRYRETPYPRALTGPAGADAVLEAAARRDVNVLKRLRGLDCGAVLEKLTGLLGPEFAPVLEELPRWQAGADFDFDGLTAFYREHGAGLFARYRAFVWTDGALIPVHEPDCPDEEEMMGYTLQRDQVIANTRALLEGKPANNVLLYGDAGTGKSSAIKAIANAFADQGLRLVEVKKNQLYQIPDLMDALASNPLKFILFIDDLSFTANDDNFAALKAILEGSVGGRAGNIAVYATSNRRHLIKETLTDREGDDIHESDTRQELMSLSARFGLTITFGSPDRERYLHIVEELAKQYGVELDPRQLAVRSEAFAVRSGGRSARVAKQFIELCKAGVFS